MQKTVPRTTKRAPRKASRAAASVAYEPSLVEQLKDTKEAAARGPG